MNIGQASRVSGLPAKTIRYYEDIGLLCIQRDAKGYRQFAQADLHKLSFVGRARALGFTIEDCRALLELYQDQSRASFDVKRIATEHLQQIDQKIRDLNILRDTLATLIASCSGDDRPDCPILRDLSGGPATSSGTIDCR